MLKRADQCRGNNDGEGGSNGGFDAFLWRYVDGTPVMVEYSRWRSDVLPGLENEDVHIPDLFYALVVDKYQVPVVRAEETLTAEMVTQKTADILQVERNTPVLVLHRTTYTRDDQIIELRITKGRSDMFSYKTEIK